MTRPLCALALAFLLASSPPAAAKGRTPAVKVAAKKPAAHAPAKKSAPASSGEARERTPSPASAAGSEGAGGADDGPVTTVQAPAASAAPAGKIKTKTYSFGAMDVEGKLKTPQLLYFLNRVKLELDMSAPDKRSFMKELQQSADDKNL
jgi:hypothetical protein